ncbi:MAG: 23S rRNA (guanosine(2251)-2'-O)-methyltransferase RlmB [Acidobacteriaceae bacterium]
MEVLYGLHPVEEAVRAGSRGLDHVIVARDRKDERLEGLVELCRSAGIRVSLEPREQLTRLAKTDAHQGVLALVQGRRLLALEDLLNAKPAAEHSFLLALDGIEDPHNLGAILRTCDAAGVDGVILPERRAAPLNATVAKTSAGASEHVRIAQVTNIVRSLEQAKRQNFWVVGLDERGSVDYTDFDFRVNVLLVLGREGAGMHELVKRTCDHLIRIPMAGSVSSLNVSVAGAVVLYEAMRQRRRASTPNATDRPAKKQKGLGS